MQTCGCSLGSTHYQPYHRQSSPYKHSTSFPYQSRPPYSLDDFQAGCGLKKYRKYGEYQTDNYKNNMTCNQFNSINFHRKCTCYLKLNLQCQCSCGMLPSMFHKLVCAPYITISKNKSSQQTTKQTKKTKKSCSNCHCCHSKPNNKQKLDLLSDQENYAPKVIQYQPQPTQIITYGPPPPVYRPTPPQSIVSFKSVPVHSVRNIIPPPPPPPPSNKIIIQPRKNTLRQMPVINQVVNQPVVRVSTGVQPTSNHGIFVLEQSKKSIKMPPPPPPANLSQTSIYQIPQQRGPIPMQMQPQQMNPNFFNFLAMQQAMQRQHQAQLLKQQQSHQMQNNQQDQYEQEIEEEEYEEVEQDGDD